jgi:hypothetical protein
VELRRLGHDKVDRTVIFPIAVRLAKKSHVQTGRAHEVVYRMFWLERKRRGAELLRKMEGLARKRGLSTDPDKLTWKQRESLVRELAGILKVKPSYIISSVRRVVNRGDRLPGADLTQAFADLATPRKRAPVDRAAPGVSNTRLSLSPATFATIDGADAARRYAQKGTGTAEDPYVISGLTFHGRVGGPALRIRNIPASTHVVLKNVRAVGGGIVLENVHNVSLRDVKVEKVVGKLGRFFAGGGGEAVGIDIVNGRRVSVKHCTVTGLVGGLGMVGVVAGGQASHGGAGGDTFGIRVRGAMREVQIEKNRIERLFGGAGALAAMSCANVTSCSGRGGNAWGIFVAEHGSWSEGGERVVVQDNEVEHIWGGAGAVGSAGLPFAVPGFAGADGGFPGMGGMAVGLSLRDVRGFAVIRNLVKNLNGGAGAAAGAGAVGRRGGSSQGGGLGGPVVGYDLVDTSQGLFVGNTAARLSSGAGGAGGAGAFPGGDGGDGGKGGNVFAARLMSSQNILIKHFLAERAVAGAAGAPGVGAAGIPTQAALGAEMAIASARTGAAVAAPLLKAGSDLTSSVWTSAARLNPFLAPAAAVVKSSMAVTGKAADSLGRFAARDTSARLRGLFAPAQTGFGAIGGYAMGLYAEDCTGLTLSQSKFKRIIAAAGAVGGAGAWPGGSGTPGGRGGAGRGALFTGCNDISVTNNRFHMITAGTGGAGGVGGLGDLLGIRSGSKGDGGDGGVSSVVTFLACNLVYAIENRADHLLAAMGAAGSMGVGAGKGGNGGHGGRATGMELMDMTPRSIVKIVKNRATDLWPALAGMPGWGLGGFGVPGHRGTAQNVLFDTRVWDLDRGGR